MPAVLITVEGVEGSGKSTQCVRLEQHLAGRGLQVVRTSEPDGTPLGLRVRALFEGPGPADAAHPDLPLQRPRVRST
jgi:dTMP kinase